MAWEVSVVTPEPMPRATLVNNITTGKVNPMAARGSVPRRDTNQVSVRLYAFMAKVPASMGKAIENSVRPTLR